MRMRILLVIVGVLTRVLSSQTYQRVGTQQAHGAGNLVTTASFFNDQVRMITGGNDNKVNIWSLGTFSIIHTITEGDYIQNVALHPTDNRIFVLVLDGVINIYDPTTYALLHTFNHPAAGGYGNYLVFDLVGGRFLMGGFDGAGVVPKIYFYNSNTYAAIGASTITTTYRADDQINTMSLNPTGTHVALTNIDIHSPPIYKVLIYRLSDRTLRNTFTFSANQLKWAIFDIVSDFFCATTFDLKNIDCYRYNTGTNLYVADKTWSTTAIGAPYCMSFGIVNTLIASVSNKLVFYNLSQATPTDYLTYIDVQDIFVLDSTIDMTYIVTGMNNGHVSIWKKNIISNQTHQQITTIQAQGNKLVTTVSFFSDKQRMITGGQDNTVRIWSLTNFTVIHSLPFTDWIQNIGLHPADNRIFVVVIDGTVNVYNGNTYAPITTINHPSQGSGGYANYMAFDVVGDRFIIGGYDGAASAPKLYYYNSADYSAIPGSTVTTTYAVDQQINTMSVNPDGTHLLLTNLMGSTNDYKLLIYKISDGSLVGSFAYNTVQVKWAIYDATSNNFCATTAAQNIDCYSYASSTNTYSLAKTWSTSAIGYPYCMSFSVMDTLIVSVGRFIVYYNITQATPTAYLTLTDVNDIFVLDNTYDMSYMATGMRYGEVGLWKMRFANNSNTIINQNNRRNRNNNTEIINNDELQQAERRRLGLIIGLSVGIPVFLILLIIVICCCCRRMGFKIRTEADQQPSKHSMRQDIEQKQMNKTNDRFVVIKQDSDNSTELDYDELLMGGTVIVIRDEDKKRKYLSNINSKQEGTKLSVKGNIIIIRDQMHSIKNKHKDTASDDSQDLDYQALMAEGCIIVIKDQELKQTFINNLKQYHQDNQHDPNMSWLLVSGNTVILKSEYDQKKMLKQANKQRQILKIKHDKLLANGDVLVIKDKNKKKQFVENMKKQLKKNNQSAQNLKGVQIADQIIIIRGEDDIDEDEMSYEQLMAQGTVIIIKDDQVKKQYAQHIQKTKNKGASKNKNGRGSDKSSEPDYATLMAQECIIVIKDDDDKRQYVNFLRNRKQRSDKSSQVCYDDLVNGNVMNIADEQNSKVIKVKKANTLTDPNKQKIVPTFDYHELMAEKNVVIINQEGIENNGVDPKDKKPNKA